MNWSRFKSSLFVGLNWNRLGGIFEELDRKISRSELEGWSCPITVPDRDDREPNKEDMASQDSLRDDMENSPASTDIPTGVDSESELSNNSNEEELLLPSQLEKRIKLSKRTLERRATAGKDAEAQNRESKDIEIWRPISRNPSRFKRIS